MNMILPTLRELVVEIEYLHKQHTGELQLPTTRSVEKMRRQLL
jgi:hypothetical protein